MELPLSAVGRSPIAILRPVLARGAIKVGEKAKHARKLVKLANSPEEESNDWHPISRIHVLERASSSGFNDSIVSGSRQAQPASFRRSMRAAAN